MVTHWKQLHNVGVKYSRYIDLNIDFSAVIKFLLRSFNARGSRLGIRFMLKILNLLVDTTNLSKSIHLSAAKAVDHFFCKHSNHRDLKIAIQCQLRCMYVYTPIYCTYIRQDSYYNIALTTDNKMKQGIKLKEDNCKFPLNFHT